MKEAREEIMQISGGELSGQMEQMYTGPKAGACLADQGTTQKPVWGGEHKQEWEEMKSER